MANFVSEFVSEHPWWTIGIGATILVPPAVIGGAALLHYNSLPYYEVKPANGNEVSSVVAPIISTYAESYRKSIMSESAKDQTHIEYQWGLGLMGRIIGARPIALSIYSSDNVPQLSHQQLEILMDVLTYYQPDGGFAREGEVFLGHYGSQPGAIMTGNRAIGASHKVSFVNLDNAADNEFDALTLGISEAAMGGRDSLPYRVAFAVYQIKSGATFEEYLAAAKTKNMPLPNKNPKLPDIVAPAKPLDAEDYRNLQRFVGISATPEENHRINTKRLERKLHTYSGPRKRAVVAYIASLETRDGANWETVVDRASSYLLSGSAL